MAEQNLSSCGYRIDTVSLAVKPDSRPMNTELIYDKQSVDTLIVRGFTTTLSCDRSGCPIFNQVTEIRNERMTLEDQKSHLVLSAQDIRRRACPLRQHNI